MAKDPTAYLRRESRAMHTPCVAERDARTARLAIAYMRERGLFDAWNDEPKAKFVPVIKGLDWNPEAPKRIVSFTVTLERSGYRDTFTYHGNKRRGGPSWGRWTETLGQVRVPHWDYDGCPPDAREAWELASTNLMMDHAARHREQDRDHSWEIEHEAHQMECNQQLVDEGNEGCAWPTMWRQAA